MNAIEWPHDLGAEYDCIGAAILNPNAANIVTRELDYADFYSESNAHIWTAIRELHDEDVEADVVAVRNILRRRERLDDEMGRRLVEIIGLTVSTANVAHKVQIVKDLSLRRRILRSLYQAREVVLDGSPLEEAIKILEGVHPPSNSQAKTLFDLLNEFEQELRNPPNLAELGVPAPLGLKPWMPGRLSIIGGYQGDGKTTIGLQCADVAGEVMKKVGIASLEMTDRDLTDRLLAMQGLDYMKVQERQFTETEKVRVKEKMAKLATEPIMVWDDPTISVEQIASWQREEKFDLLVVDHLHQFDWKGERHIIESIVKKLVALAKKENIPVLLLAQLKRPFNTDKAPPPTMSMLRETGMIEALAAMVLFVYRPRNEDGLRDNRAKLICAKNRFGQEFVEDLEFVGSSVFFTERWRWAS